MADFRPVLQSDPNGFLQRRNLDAILAPFMGTDHAEHFAQRYHRCFACRTVRFVARLPYVGRYVEQVEAGLAELARTPSLVQLILSTCAARLFTAVQYLALFAAVGLPLGFWQAWFVLSVRTLLLAIPIQGPAGLGTTQLWWVTALMLLGTPAHTAIAAGLSVHLLDLVVSLSLAALGWLLLALPRRRRRPD